MYKNNIFDDINIAHFNYKLFFFCRVFLNAPLNILQRPKHQPHPKSVIRQLNDITIRLRQQIERRERHNKSKYKPYVTIGFTKKIRSTYKKKKKNSDVRYFMSNRALPNRKPTILVVCLILNVKAAYIANDKNLNMIA